MILFLFSVLGNSKHSWTDNNSIKICRRNLNKIDMLSRIADGVQRSSFLDTCPPYCSTSILGLATVPDSMILTISINLYRWTPVLSLLCWIVRWSAHLLLLNFILVIVECMLCGFVLLLTESCCSGPHACFLHFRNLLGSCCRLCLILHRVKHRLVASSVIFSFIWLVK